MSREGFPSSVEVEHALGIVQQLRETFHDLRQPVAVVSALAAAALTEPDLSAAAQPTGADRRTSRMAGPQIYSCLAAQGKEEPAEIEKSDDGYADIVSRPGVCPSSPETSLSMAED
jgi:hypothetical protein